MAEQHSSQRIMVLTIVAAIVLILVVVPFAIKHHASASMENNADNADVRIQPVARFELAAAPAADTGTPKDGPTVFNTVCAACHNTGAAGAPKAGDKAAWGPRIAQGKAALYQSALNGKNAMPARGGASTLSDTEVKAAVDHLVSLAK